MTPICITGMYNISYMVCHSTEVALQWGIAVYHGDIGLSCVYRIFSGTDTGMSALCNKCIRMPSGVVLSLCGVVLVIPLG